ncbi:hypothetical protein E4U41_007514 [Claviceps citrina]|nr:hypothetical protein E4U41_007514 [Claviceps citrina]
MGFLGIYTATYDYEPRAEGELAIAEGDILYLLDKGDNDGWWKAKKKAGGADEDEPVGLVPSNYIEEAPVVNHARAIYEYTRQTDEELSFSEEVILQVYDTSDPDWILVGLNDEYGFVPANYIHVDEPAEIQNASSSAAPPALPVRPQSAVDPKELRQNIVSSPSEPAAALAGVFDGRSSTTVNVPVSSSPPSSQAERPRTQSSEHPVSELEADDTEAQSPALPNRSRPRVLSRKTSGNTQEPLNLGEVLRTPGGFHMYNINEMVSVMGKRKKIPTTLGINLGTGTILIAPEFDDDEAPQEWTAEKMTHYSREGKHVFIELVQPSKSVDFHAGAKDTAEEIVAALAELSGAVRMEGLREVIMAGSQRRQRKGQVLYDFMAQGDDEVTVAAGEEVLVVDDSKSEEWWQVRRLKNGQEGVVPSSYVEIIGTVISPKSNILEADLTRGTVEKNRFEEIRLTKDAIKASKEPQQVGPGALHPERGSSLVSGEHNNNSRQQRGKHENGRNDMGNHAKPKTRPDSSKVRTWTDRSGSFSVDAQFLGLKDSKIHLHKMNGVKIAVPIAKMSRDDLEYVEKMTGISLDDDKPLADVKRAKATDKRGVQAGASISKNVKPEYDWFQFFLSCDVPVGLCERYAQAFTKDSMDESVLPDVNATILRTLGLREGDIIKVMRNLDTKFGRDRNNQDSDANSGGLFSGPGGALRNNTRKGRPAPAIQTSDIVDAAAFATSEKAANSTGSATLNNPRPSIAEKPKGGFDDDAWDVKSNNTTSQQKDSPNRTVTPHAAQPASPSKAETTSVLTGSMKDLSLLTEPLQPSKTEPSGTTAAAHNSGQQDQAPLHQPTGATASFFSTMSNATQPKSASLSLDSLGTTSSPTPHPRQRPLPTSFSSTQGSLVPPPPQRPTSTPQLAQSSVFAAPYLNDQVTGTRQGQVAPPGQSLNDLAQARLQQQYSAQYQQLQPAMTGHISLPPQGMTPFTPGVPSQQQMLYPMMTGPAVVSPFHDGNRHTQFLPIQSQPTGYQTQFPPSMSTFPQAATLSGNMPGLLAPALEPQRTGFPSQQVQQMSGNTGLPQPLQPQKTGPPPPVRFGISPDSRKLTPQQTGRRANLSQATPDNPFGF